MIWRRQPPVLSPVPPRALFDGFGATVGLHRNARDWVRSELRRRYRCVDALLTDSGTSALVLALRRLVPAGGIVAYPAYACIDLITAASGAGVRVRLYDVDPATLSPDLDSVRAVIGRGVDAIVVAHLYGYPADVVGVHKLATEHGIPVIEDAAQSAGGTLHELPLGSFGDIAIRSFGRGKGTTGGGGGAMLVLDPRLSDWTSNIDLPAGSRGLMAVLTLSAQSVLTHPYLYSIPSSIPGLRLGEMVYHAPRAPRGMSDASAAILHSTLQLEAREASARRDRAKDLVSRFHGIAEVAMVRPVPGGASGFLRLAMVDNAGQRMPRTDLGALRGYPLTLDQHAQSQRLLVSGECAGKGSRFLRDRLFTLPTHARVGKADLARFSEWLGARVVQSAFLAAVT
jgi:dTDP-4-amino-4,6-dideoxygalactose transaminase